MLNLSYSANEKLLFYARKIASERKRQGFSQKDFAKQIGISPSYLAKIESGQAMAGLSVDLLHHISDGLSLSLGQLLTITKQDLMLGQLYMQKQIARKRRKTLYLCE